MSTLDFHTLASLFPLLEGADFDGLVDDIRTHGLREPVVLYQGRVLDGRNRLRACELAGVAPRFETYTGDDPVAYMISLNLRRRHLSESQRAMVAAKLATLAHGQRQTGQLAAVPTQDEAAALLNVGDRSVRRAVEVRDRGADALISAVERGEISVSAAADVSALPKEKQDEIVARGKKEILEAAKAIRAEESKARYAARVARIAETSARNTPLESDRRYPVILADPPWDYRLYNETSGSARAAAEHYPTMELQEICGLPVADIATDDAILFMWTTVLFMWTTVSHLREAFEVLAAWGFEYKSNAVWVKHTHGLGFFVRGQHELLLIATKGDIPCPLPANRPSSVINAPRREHSRKPDETYGLIEQMYPELPKIELFARNARKGWARWGNEAETAPDDGIPNFLRRTSNARI
jgi:N6-adenosine-specific RNA methylase IME4